MALLNDKKARIDQACSTGEEFTKLYYECLDKRRNLLAKLYLESGILVWNGHASTGNTEIQKFFETLPASVHNVITLDAQPVLDQAVQNQSTVLISCFGQVTFGTQPAKNFTQNFVVTAQGDKWKVVSDTFRFDEILP